MTSSKQDRDDFVSRLRTSRWSIRVMFIGLLVLLIVVAVAALPPLPEPRTLWALTDDRTFLGIANFLNVLSNLPLLLVGAWALYILSSKQLRSGAFADAIETVPYTVFFLSVVLASLGSAYFHLHPDSSRLFWDRLPMSLGFGSLLSTVVVERISLRAGLRLLVPLLLIGAGSVVYWRWTASHGKENLLPYAAVQYGSMVIILAIALLFRSRYTRGGDLICVLAIYGLAKVAELFDAGIYGLGHVVSGHTVKHLIAAIAVWWLLRMLRFRSLQQLTGSAEGETRSSRGTENRAGAEMH